MPQNMLCTDADVRGCIVYVLRFAAMNCFVV